VLELQDAEASAPQVYDLFALAQGLALGDAGQHAVEMDRLSGFLVVQGRRQIFDRFSATGTRGLGGSGARFEKPQTVSVGSPA
jgi:hypothetical protein